VPFAANFKQKTALVYLAIPRIFVGYHFISVAIPKLTRGFTNGEDLPAQLLKSVARDPIGLHRAFIQGFVIPHAGFFSYLVVYGELAIGISLVLGCLVRVSSFFGAFHNLNILLAVAIPSGGAQAAVNAVFIAAHIAFVFSSAGLVLGLDALLKKWFPRSLLF
jgi:thiosulfate dehydrogenase [quinone] large subunit